MIELTEQDERLSSIYKRLSANLQMVRSRLHRPLVLTEKLLFAHLRSPEAQDLSTPNALLALQPDRIAMQDGTAQMALLQFLFSEKKSSAVPVSIHCDHLIRANQGAASDLQTSRQENAEVFDFLESASASFGFDFWEAGSGIIHQVVLENDAFPGGLLVGTDSHSPNAGGLAMIGIGAGGGEAAAVMVGASLDLPRPRVIGVRLLGELSEWTAAKDVILELCQRLTTRGATGDVLEYFGPGAETLSATAKATMTNLGAELGAAFSIFPYDRSIAEYLVAVGRGTVAAMADEYRDLLRADPGSERSYHTIIEINLDHLSPQVAGPHSPDAVWPIGNAPSFGEDVPLDLSAALIGSCTNSSYEDLARAASLARQAVQFGLMVKVPLLISPGSERTRKTAEERGLFEPLLAIGGTVLANACGPCAGQWTRSATKPNTIVTSFNRNFRARNDGNPNTNAFLASPEIVVAMALSGRLDFDPRSDAITLANGGQVRLRPPDGDALPDGGFIHLHRKMSEPRSLRADSASDRIRPLEPFPAPNAETFCDVALLTKIEGRCTTDHISPVGRWMRYRGNLHRILDNLLLGARDAITGLIGQDFSGKTFAASARDYKEQKQSWLIVADWNYGEGSSREHAAMSPRYLGGVAVIARSFARIHESNLKRQGMLALTFRDPCDYDRVRAGDRFKFLDLRNLAPGNDLQVQLRSVDGTVVSLKLAHTYTDEQISWFWSGSALNQIRNIRGS